MVKTVIGSLVAAALVGGGLLAGRATARGATGPARDGGECCTEGRCDATIECNGDGCVIRFTAADGRSGEIELSCKDGECRVVRCTPCCGSEAGAASPAAESSSCGR